MDRTSTLRDICALVFLAASGLAVAGDNSSDHRSMHGGAGQHHQFDPVAHTQRNLDALEAKLNLRSEQRGAWQAYAENALARAREAASRMEERRARQGETGAEADTAARLERMSLRLRERAERLQQVAQDTRKFEDALSSEQKTIFDLYWKAQWHQRKMGHRPAA
jgi:hypothetical protein